MDHLPEWVAQQERCPQFTAWTSTDGSDCRLFFTFGDHIFTEDLTWTRYEPGQTPENVFYFEDPADYAALKDTVNTIIGPAIVACRLEEEYGLVPGYYAGEEEADGPG